MLFICYMFFVAGFFALMVGIQSEDLKIKDLPMLLLLAFIWPYVLALWVHDHYIKK